MPLWLCSACDTVQVWSGPYSRGAPVSFGEPVWSVSDRRAVGARPEGQTGDSFAGASLSPGGTCVAALPTRRSQARRAETDFTAVQRAGACALSDVLMWSWSEQHYGSTNSILKNPFVAYLIVLITQSLCVIDR